MEWEETSTGQYMRYREIIDISAEESKGDAIEQASLDKLRTEVQRWGIM